MNELSAMQAFCKVARTNSFSDAAREMGLSKAVVSRRVGELEDSLGIRLLNRTTRRVSLTDAGLAYLVRSQRILDDLNELQETTRSLSETPTGLLRVTAPDTFGQVKIASLLKRFLRQHPNVSVQLDLTNRYVDIVEEGFDLAIRIGKLKDSSLFSRKILRSRVYACASPAYIEEFGEPALPSDLEPHTCITYKDRSLRFDWRFKKGTQEFIVSVADRVQVNSYDAAYRMVRDGLGIALLPDYLIEEDISAGRLLHLLSSYRYRNDDVHAIFPHKHYMSPKVRTFIEYLADNLRGGSAG